MKKYKISLKDFCIVVDRLLLNAGSMALTSYLYRLRYEKIWNG